MNTAFAGIWAEARFIMIAAEKNWEVAKPVHHAQAYDCVARIWGVWSTVQAKKAFWHHREGKASARTISVRRCNEKGARPYKDGDFDYLFVAHGEFVWLIPWHVIRKHKSTVSVSSSKYDEWKL